MKSPIRYFEEDTKPQGAEWGTDIKDKLRVQLEKAKLPFTLDDWQKQFFEISDGNVVAVTGRQVGKTEIVSILAGLYGANYKGIKIGIVSLTEDQAYLIHGRILRFLEDNFKPMISKKKKPTKTEIWLTNGSSFEVKPLGATGGSVRGRTWHIAIEDESARTPEEAQDAILPTMLTTGGWHWKISTPDGQEGHYYKSFISGEYKTIQISSMEVAQKREEPIKSRMIDFLTRKKREMTAFSYAREFGGEFLSAIKRVFPDEWIRKVCTGKRPTEKSQEKHYWGCDVGGFGEDPSYHSVGTINSEGYGIHIELIRTDKTTTTEVSDMAKLLHAQYEFKKMGIDDGGIGFGVYCNLLDDDKTKTRIIALNNSSREVDYQGQKSTKLKKEEMYEWMKAMGEQGKLQLLDDEDLKLSLMSILQEPKENGVGMRIYSENSHAVEATMRWTYFARTKPLNLWVR